MTDVALKVSSDSSSARLDLDKLNKSVVKVGESAVQVTNKVTNGTQSVLKSLAATATGSAKSVQAAADTTASAIANTTKLAVRLGVAIGSYSVAKGLLATADQFTNLNNKLKLVTNSTQELLGVERKLIDLSRETRSGYRETLGIYSTLTKATKGFAKSQQEVLRVAESLNKSISISGASAESASAGLLQLSQGLQSGVLRGEELNSVLEQLPAVADSIATGIGSSIGAIRGLAEQGKLTTDVVFNALLATSDKVDEAFAKTVPTVQQALNQIRFTGSLIVKEYVEATGNYARLANFLFGASKTADDVILNLRTNILTFKYQIVSTIASIDKLGAAATALRAIDLFNVNLFDLYNTYEQYKFFESKIKEYRTLLELTGLKPIKINQKIEFNADGSLINTNITDIGKSQAAVSAEFGRQILRLFQNLKNSASKLVPDIRGPVQEITSYMRQEFLLVNRQISASFYRSTREVRKSVQGLYEVFALVGGGEAFGKIRDRDLERSVARLFNTRNLSDFVEGLKRVNFYLATPKLDRLGVDILTADINSFRISSVENMKAVLRFFNIIDNRILFLNNVRFDRLIYTLKVTGYVFSEIFDYYFFAPVYRMYARFYRYAVSFYEALSDALFDNLTPKNADKIARKFVDGVRKSFSDAKRTVTALFSDLFSGTADFSGLSSKPIIKELLLITNFLTRVFTSSFRYAFSDALLSFQKMISGVQLYSGRLESVFNYIKEFGHKVAQVFYLVWDKVVGHSYWPDLVDDVNSYTKKLVGSENRVFAFGRRIIDSFKNTFITIYKLLNGYFSNNFVRNINFDTIRSGFLAAFSSALLSVLQGGKFFAQLGIVSGDFLKGVLLIPLLKSIDEVFGTRLTKSIAETFGQGLAVLLKGIVAGIVEVANTVIELLPSVIKGFASEFQGFTGILTKMASLFSFMSEDASLISASLRLVGPSFIGRYLKPNKGEQGELADAIGGGKDGKGGKEASIFESYFSIARAVKIAVAGKSSEKPLIDTMFFGAVADKNALLSTAINLGLYVFTNAGLLATAITTVPLLLISFLGEDGTGRFIKDSVLGVVGLITRSISGGGQGLFSTFFSQSKILQEGNQLVKNVSEVAKRIFTNIKNNRDEYAKGTISLKELFSTEQVEDPSTVETDAARKKREAQNKRRLKKGLEAIAAPEPKKTRVNSFADGIISAVGSNLTGIGDITVDSIKELAGAVTDVTQRGATALTGFLAASSAKANGYYSAFKSSASNSAKAVNSSITNAFAGIKEAASFLGGEEGVIASLLFGKSGKFIAIAVLSALALLFASNAEAATRASEKTASFGEQLLYVATAITSLVGAFIVLIPVIQLAIIGFKGAGIVGAWQGALLGAAVGASRLLPILNGLLFVVSTLTKAFLLMPLAKIVDFLFKTSLAAKISIISLKGKVAATAADTVATAANTAANAVNTQSVVANTTAKVIDINTRAAYTAGQAAAAAATTGATAATAANTAALTSNAVAARVATLAQMGLLGILRALLITAPLNVLKATVYAVGAAILAVFAPISGLIGLFLTANTMTARLVTSLGIMRNALALTGILALKAFTLIGGLFALKALAVIAGAALVGGVVYTMFFGKGETFIERLEYNKDRLLTFLKLKEEYDAFSPETAKLKRTLPKTEVGGFVLDYTSRFEELDYTKISARQAKALQGAADRLAGVSKQISDAVDIAGGFTKAQMEEFNSAKDDLDRNLAKAAKRVAGSTDIDKLFADTTKLLETEVSTSLSKAVSNVLQSLIDDVSDLMSPITTALSPVTDNLAKGWDTVTGAIGRAYKAVKVYNEARELRNRLDQEREDAEPTLFDKIGQLGNQAAALPVVQAFSANLKSRAYPEGAGKTANRGLSQQLKEDLTAFKEISGYSLPLYQAQYKAAVEEISKAQAKLVFKTNTSTFSEDIREEQKNLSLAVEQYNRVKATVFDNAELRKGISEQEQLEAVYEDSFQKFSDKVRTSVKSAFGGDGKLTYEQDTFLLSIDEKASLTLVQREVEDILKILEYSLLTGNERKAVRVNLDLKLAKQNALAEDFKKGSSLIGEQQQVIEDLKTVGVEITENALTELLISNKEQYDQLVSARKLFFNKSVDFKAQTASGVDLPGGDTVARIAAASAEQRAAGDALSAAGGKAVSAATKNYDAINAALRSLQLPEVELATYLRNSEKFNAVREELDALAKKSNNLQKNKGQLSDNEFVTRLREIVGSTAQIKRNIDNIAQTSIGSLIDQFSRFGADLYKIGRMSDTQLEDLKKRGNLRKDKEALVLNGTLPADRASRVAILGEKFGDVDPATFKLPQNARIKLVNELQREDAVLTSSFEDWGKTAIDRFNTKLSKSGLSLSFDDFISIENATDRSKITRIIDEATKEYNKLLNSPGVIPNKVERLAAAKKVLEDSQKQLDNIVKLSREPTGSYVSSFFSEITDFSYKMLQSLPKATQSLLLFSGSAIKGLQEEMDNLKGRGQVDLYLTKSIQLEKIKTIYSQVNKLISFFTESAKRLEELATAGLSKQFEAISSGAGKDALTLEMIATIDPRSRKRLAEEAAQLDILKGAVYNFSLPQELTSIIEQLRDTTVDTADVYEEFMKKAEMILPADALAQLKSATQDASGKLLQSNDNLVNALDRVTSAITGKSVSTAPVSSNDFGTTLISGKKIPDSAVNSDTLKAVNNRNLFDGILSKLSGEQQAIYKAGLTGVKIDPTIFRSLAENAKTDLVDKINTAFESWRVLKETPLPTEELRKSADLAAAALKEATERYTAAFVDNTKQLGLAFKENVVGNLRQTFKDLLKGNLSKEEDKSTWVAFRDKILGDFTGNVIDTFVDGAAGSLFKDGGVLSGILSTLGVGIAGEGSALGTSAARAMWVQFAGFPGLTGLPGGLSGLGGVLGATGPGAEGPGMLAGLQKSITGFMNMPIGTAASTAFTFMKGLFGFADGGFIPGHGTGAVPVVAHAGELILNQAQQARVAASLSAGQGQQVNINITGDISRQTKSEIYKMLPSIAEGVNSHNREKGFRGR